MQRISASCLYVVMLLGCGGRHAPDVPVTTVELAADRDRDAGAPTAPEKEGPPVSFVAPDNVRPLNGAALPFAKYLSHMHNRIHPIFTDQFLAKLDQASTPGPASDRAAFTTLEIVLSSDGSVHRAGIIHASGSSVLDVGAIDSVLTAAPFGQTPPEIRSPDGYVYVQWEFHRDPVYGCSTTGVRPFLLKAAQPTP